MKDLSVKFWAKRGHFVINAARIGLTVNHGNFATEKEAEAEAELLKAKFLAGAIVQPSVVTKMS